MSDQKTFAIIVVAIEVHKKLGSGFLESGVNPLNTNYLFTIFNLKKKSAEIGVICGLIFA